MKTIIISLILISVYRCSGQIPFLPTFSGQCSDIPQIKTQHLDDSIDFGGNDSITYTLNFNPDSVSNINKNKNFHILSSRNSSSATTVNKVTETKSTYTYKFSPITSNSFKFPSPIFYKNGKTYTTDSVQIKVKHRDLTVEDFRKLKKSNQINDFFASDNILQIAFKDNLGYLGVWKNGKFEIVKELDKNQIKKINKIIKK